MITKMSHDWEAAVVTIRYNLDEMADRMFGGTS